MRSESDSAQIPQVTILTHTGALGGAERFIPRLVAPLRERCYDIHVLTFSEGLLVDALRNAGVTVEVLALDSRVVHTDRYDAGRIALSRIRPALATILYTLRLARRLRRDDIEVVHGNSLKAGLIGGVAARLARKPFVWYVHDRISDDYLPRRTAMALRWAIYHLADEVLVNSEATLLTLDPRSLGHARVAYPGLEPEAFTAPNRVTGSDPIIGMIGRISPTKGQDIFLRAAEKVHRTYPTAQFVIVGAALFNESEYERDLKNLVRELHLSEVVRFTGQIPDIHAELARFSAVVHASPVPEPFGQVLLESMAAGIPVIGTEAGGVPEILVDPDSGPGGSELGLLIPCADVDALALAMCRIIGNPDESAERASRAVASVRRRFTLDSTADALTAAWERAALSRPKRHQHRHHI